MDSFRAAGNGSTASNGSASAKSALTYDATARYVDGGKLQLDIRLMGDPIENLDYQRVERSIDNVMGALASNDLPISLPDEDIRISFDISGLSLESNGSGKADINFFPGDLEFEVTELPKVIIKYIGGPIYIPKSSDPNYVEPAKFDAFA